MPPVRHNAALARWGIFWALAVGVALAWGWANGSGRVELAFIDHLSAMNGRPASQDIVIVAIDDRSIAELGRWPWRRSVHAALLDRLREAGSRVVGLDLIFTEPDAVHPADDERLAEAVRLIGNVVLPVHMQRLGNEAPQALMPVPALMASARGLGHIHVELGGDGVARSVFLREGTGGESWDHWTLALLAAAGEPVPPGRLPGLRRPAGKLADQWVDKQPEQPEQPLPRASQGRADERKSAPPAGQTWSRDYWTQIPFAGPPGHFRRVSYIDVLDGRVPADALRGKFVLVGATAAGMGDAYLTPMASQDTLMPGVEVTANLLDSLRRGLSLRRAAPWENALFTALPMLLAVAALFWLRPRWAFCGILLLMLVVYVAAWWSQRVPGVQFAPLAALLCLGIVYPLWSWLRIEAAIGYLSAEFRALQRDDKLLTALPATRRWAGDELDRRMRAMERGVEHLRTLQRFVRESLDHLADAVLVADRTGAILLANRAAARYFGMAAESLRDRAIDGVLSGRLVSLNGQALPSFPREMRPPGAGAQSSAQDDQHEGEVPARDAQMRDLLLKWVPRHGPQGDVAGWIVSIVDISTVQQAQRQREEALRFISHDMRAPQSSILTLIELQRLEPASGARLLERIEGHARRTLALADDFVHLASARSAHYEFVPVNLADVVIDAVDRFWDDAHARRVDIVTELPAEGLWCRADREPLTRAVANLIDNALKYGRDGGRIRCALSATSAGCAISVQDDGPGVPAEHRPLLFDAFQRAGVNARVPGAGLGLAFVQAVAQRHQGTVAVFSLPGQGAEFRIELPVADEDTEVRFV